MTLFETEIMNKVLLQVIRGEKFRQSKELVSEETSSKVQRQSLTGLSFLC
jgi:hypothetical protein